MSARFTRGAVVVLGLAVAASLSFRLVSATDRVVTLPDPQVDSPLAKAPAQATAVVAGGCFWGIQAVFQHVTGVTRAISGYSGGTAVTAKYAIVGSGLTGHAESVEITYDPSKISYGQLLKVFFAVAHDPTQLNRQGPDMGTQYRSVIFYQGEEQQRIAQSYVAQLEQAKSFSRRIVTEITPLKGFYEAEAYHQNYATRHPNDPYIVINDAPKVVHLKQQFPQLYISN